VADAPAPPDGRSRHWLIDAAAGGGFALILITAANAALPRVTPLPPANLLPAPAARPRPAAPKTPPAPPTPVLIAFRAPLPGYPVISPFGLRRLPWEDNGRLHAGVDIAAPKGLPVLAAADGVVTRVAIDPGYGRFVELKHAAGLSTRYAHLDRFLPQIASGVAVKAGTPVGEIGSTGTSTGSHLHFEIRDDEDRPLNPEMFLGRSFATAAQLPLRLAERIPRGVRVAYVSNIPRSKREAMQAKLDAAEADAAADEADSGAPPRLAANAGQHGVDASAALNAMSLGRSRPHGRLIARN
jgi:hypothetical protein